MTTKNTKKASPKSKPGGLSVEEKRNRDARMQHFLNNVAIWQVAAGAVAHYGGFGQLTDTPKELVTAFVDHNRYFNAVMPDSVELFDLYFYPVNV